MNRFTSPALLASLALMAGAAVAQSTQDKTAVSPGQEQIQTQQQDPSARGMDDNTQRQHSRDQGSGATGKGSTATGGSTESTGATASMSGNQAAGQSGTRAPADANNDNLVTPEEMEASLKAGGTPAAKPAAATKK